MSFDVVFTDHFERQIKHLSKKYRSVKKDLEMLISQLEINPMQGTPIGKDCYKIRLSLASKGRGKTSGARVITHVHVKGKKVYLISIYDKSSTDNISDREIKKLINDIIK